jgi:single-strand DNA-binding protein
MAGLNKVMLIGRLGKDPELKYTQSGIPYANFTLATSDVWVDKAGQRQEETEWHNIIAWNKQAENIAKYLSKGKQVYVEGKITTDSWEDKESGKKCYATKIQAALVQFLDSSTSNNQGQNQGARDPQEPKQFQRGAAQTQQQQKQQPVDLEQIPF